MRLFLNSDGHTHINKTALRLRGLTTDGHSVSALRPLVYNRRSRRARALVEQKRAEVGKDWFHF